MTLLKNLIKTHIFIVNISYLKVNFKKNIFSIISILLFQLIVPNEVYGQEKEVITPSQLKKLTIGQLVDTIKVSSPDKADIFTRALIDSQEKNLIKAGKLMEIGYFFYKKKAYERCIDYMNHASKLFREPEDDKYLYRLYVVKGNANLYNWKNAEALNDYYKALEINHNSINDKIKEATINLNIAIVRRKMGQLDIAENVYKNTLEFIENSKVENSITHVKVLSEISFLYIDLEKYDAVLRYSDIGIRISELYDYREELANFYTAKGIIFSHKKKYEEALEYLLDAEDILQNTKLPEKRYLINIAYYIAKCFYGQEYYEKSISKMKEVIDFIDDDEFNTEAIDLYNLLAASNKAIGNESQTIYWYEKSIQLDKRSEKEKDITVTTLHNKEKQDLGKEISVLTNTKFKVAIALFFSFFALIIILTIYYKKQESNKLLFNELIEKITDLETEKVNNARSVETTEQVNIDHETVNKVLKELEKLEEREYFLNIDCSLSSMSKKVKTNTVYLSKIINVYKGKKFNVYINDLRIDYVLKRLKNDKTFRLFSVKSIAMEIGYKSDYSFAKHFKAKTGLNPSYYIKNINKLKV